MDRVCLKSKTKNLKEVLEILDLPFSEYLLRKGIAIKVFKKAINSYTPSDWKRYSNVFKYLGEERTLIKEFFPNAYEEVIVNTLDGDTGDNEYDFVQDVEKIRFYNCQTERAFRKHLDNDSFLGHTKNIYPKLAKAFNDKCLQFRDNFLIDGGRYVTDCSKHQGGSYRAIGQFVPDNYYRLPD